MGGQETKYNNTSMIHAMEDGRTIKQTYGIYVRAVETWVCVGRRLTGSNMEPHIYQMQIKVMTVGE